MTSASANTRDTSTSRNPRRVLIARGVLAVVLGVVCLGWPGITVGVLVMLFALSAFVAAATELVAAVHADGVGPTLGHVTPAALSAAAGVLALLWPGATAVLLTWVVAFWAFATGVGELGLATRHGLTATRRTMWVVGGLLSVALALTLAVLPTVGPTTLGILFGLFSAAHGVTVLARAVAAGGTS